jgi:hypothetical protein
MTSRMWLRASSEVAEGVEVLADLVEGVVGVQRCSLSLARQWGRFVDGRGQRLGGYGRSFGAKDVGLFVSAAEVS